MAYRIAGIDVHKKMLAVVVADVEGESEYQFERRQFGRFPPSRLRAPISTPVGAFRREWGCEDNIIEGWSANCLVPD